MEKRETFMVILVIALFLIISIPQSFQQQTSSQPSTSSTLTDDQKRLEEIKHYAKVLEDFFKLNPSLQSSKLKTDLEIKTFLETLESSNNLEKFYEAWTEFREENAQTPEKESTISKISDETKNQIWQYLSKQGTSSQDYLKKIATRLFEKKYGSIDWKDHLKRGIDRVILTNPEKLKWHGNKIGFENEKGELTAWLDLENIPNWVKEIKTTENSFDLTLDTGKGNWNLNFDKGSVGSLLQAIGPDGNVIGIHRNNGFTGIKYDTRTGEFTAEYSLGDGSPPRTITFKKEDLNPVLKKQIDELIAKNPEQIGNLNKVLKRLQGTIGLNLLSDDSRKKYGLPHENILSFAIQNPAGSKIFSTFDENGKPIVKTDNKAVFATLSSKLEIERTYETLQGKLSGEFLFDKQGNILEGTAGRLNVIGLGSADFEEKTGVHIIRSTLADAIARDDEKAIVERIVKDYKLIERGLSGNTDMQVELIRIIDKELRREGTSIETKSRLQAAREFYVENIRQTMRNIGEFLITGGQSELSPAQSSARDAFLKIAESEINKQVEYLLQNPSELQALIGSDPKKSDEVSRKLLSEIAGSSEVREILGNRFLSDFLGQDSIEKIQEEIKTTDFYDVISKTLSGKQKTSTEDIVNTIIANYPGLASQRNLIQEIITKATEKVDSEIQSFRAREAEFLQELSRSKQYENYIVLNEDSKNIYAKGRKISINAAGPLNKFIVENTATGSYDHSQATHLYNRGNHILSFYGDKTYTTRVVESNPYYEFASIREIINGKKSWNNRIILDNPRGYYELYDPSDLFSRQYTSRGMAHTTKKFLFFTFDINIPFTSAVSEVVSPRETDIGEVDGAEITLHRNTVPHPTGAFKSSKARGFNEKVRQRDAQTGGESLGELFGIPIYQGLQNQMQSKIQQAGGQEAFNRKISETQNYITSLQRLGISVPLEATDMLYLAQNPRAFDRVYNFFNNLRLPNKGYVKITNKYISVYGNGHSGMTTYTLSSQDVNPAVFRSIMRNIQKDPSRLQKYQRIEG